MRMTCAAACWFLESWYPPMEFGRGIAGFMVDGLVREKESWSKSSEWGVPRLMMVVRKLDEFLKYYELLIYAVAEFAGGRERGRVAEEVPQHISISGRGLMTLRSLWDSVNAQVVDCRHWARWCWSGVPSRPGGRKWGQPSLGSARREFASQGEFHSNYNTADDRSLFKRSREYEDSDSKLNQGTAERQVILGSVRLWGQIWQSVGFHQPTLFAIEFSRRNRGPIISNLNTYCFSVIARSRPPPNLLTSHRNSPPALHTRSQPAPEIRYRHICGHVPNSFPAAVS
jgi:hypothetical protein